MKSHTNVTHLDNKESEIKCIQGIITLWSVPTTLTLHNMQFVSVDCATQYSTRQKEHYLCCSHVLHALTLPESGHGRFVNFVSHSIEV